MRRVLITGASGFLGQYLVRALNNEYEVHCTYENPDSRAKNPEIRPEFKHMMDLDSPEDIMFTARNVQPHFVIHLAAKSEVALSFDNYDQVSRINYVGTVNLAEACRQFAPELELFVMASTMETYGHHNPSDGPFTEETLQRPMAPYAVAKLASERYLDYMRYAYDFPSTVLRQTNTYGRTDNDFFVVERIITQMLRSGVCNLGEPTPMRNFLWVGDLVELYRTILASPEKALGETFVTGPDNAVTIGRLAEMICYRLRWDGDINWHTIPKRPGEIYYLNSIGTKAEKLLGWTPKVSIHEGLNRTIEIWRDR